MAESSAPSRRERPLAVEWRRAIRAGHHAGITSGLAPGYAQANLAVVPAAAAADFVRFCNLNPFACPLLGVSEPGDPRIPALGADLDVRTDLPAYRIYEQGSLAKTVGDIS